MIVISNKKEDADLYSLKDYMIFEDYDKLADKVIEVFNNYEETYDKHIVSNITTSDFYKPFIDLPESLPHAIPEGAVVLIKGTRKASMERFAARLRQKQHQTKLEINLSALRNNLVQFKNLLGSEVKLLVMVK